MIWRKRGTCIRILRYVALVIKPNYFQVLGIYQDKGKYRYEADWNWPEEWQWNEPRIQKNSVKQKSGQEKALITKDCCVHFMVETEEGEGEKNKGDSDRCWWKMKKIHL